MAHGEHGLQARADQSPLRPREPLYAASHDVPVGSIEPPLGRQFVEAGLPVVQTHDGWCVMGPALNASFERIATWLDEHAPVSAWRNELLNVADASGVVVGVIERGAVRPLGIATQAVHLVGWAEQGGVWVQQRAFDKATDPGQWDTLMGGLVSAGESIADTLARETWEEAGLRLDALRAVGAQARLTVRRPVANGYMVEHIHVYDAWVPAALTPLNQDGEVAAFERLGLDELRQRLRADAFTLEAALILTDALRRDGHAG